MPNEVLVVLTCYSRPQNMPQVIDAWNRQTVPVNVIVVDNRKWTPIDFETYQGDTESIEEYPCSQLSGNGYDAPLDVWRWMENSGCPCWLAPAIMLGHKYKYIVRADDDLLPGKRAVEHLLKTAYVCDDDFSTIGQVGRRFTEDKYNRSNVKQWPFCDSKMTRVDLTCRALMVKSRDVIHAFDFRQQLLDTGEPDAAKLVDVHDDFLICMGVQLATEHPSYITSYTDDDETQLVKTDIPNGPESCYKRPGHYEERQRMVELSRMVGWRSLV